MKKLYTKWHALVLLVMVTGMVLIAWVFNTRPQYIEVNSATFMTMGTFAQIQLRCNSEEVAREAQSRVMKMLQDIDLLISTYRDDSELSQVNRLAASQPVKVSRETYFILEKSKYYSRISNGAFDITVTPLIKMWDEAKEKGKWPSQEEMARVLQKVGYKNLILSDEEKLEVSFAQEGIQLNVNAIAKGYVVDRALDAVRIPGVMAALVDIGGEIACFGQDQPGKDWVIGVQDPFAEDNDNQLSERPCCFLKVSNMSVATSGDYRRYIELEGHKLSHIIDPRTGLPANKLPSVTVISPKAVDADALATAVSVLGIEDGLALIESIPDTEALLIAGTRDKPVECCSTGFNKYKIGKM